MTRTEKLAEARLLLDETRPWLDTRLRDLHRLTLDLIETSETGSGASQSAHDTSHTSSREEAPKSAALSPAPDFAALAEDFHEHGTYLEPFQRKCLATWLRANSRRLANTAPAVVGLTDESVVEWAMGWARPCPPGDPEYRQRFADGLRRELLARTPAPAPAFDVEALIKRVSKALLEDGWSDMQVGMICSTLRVVAREICRRR